MITAEKRSELIEIAQTAYPNAYARYSNYSVGAALLAEDGRVFTGVNVENAVYPLTICAERAAVFNAVSEGARKFQAIAVVTEDGGFPCGSCRQVLAEFGLDIEVVVADLDGNIKKIATVAELLPDSFGVQNLKKTG
jgi:cytidine deaminase